MSTTIADIKPVPTAPGEFYSPGDTLTVTRFLGGERFSGLGCQITIGGPRTDYFQYALLDEQRARQLQDAIDEIYGSRA